MGRWASFSSMGWASFTYLHASIRVSRGSMRSTTSPFVGRSERGPQPEQPVFDHGAVGFRVGRVLDLAPVRRSHSALDWDASPLTGGPSEPQVQSVWVAETVRGIGRDSVSLAHVELDLGHFCLRAGNQGAYPTAHRGLALGVGAQHEPRHVQEYDHGQVEGVAQVNEVSVLLGGPAIHRSGERSGVAAYDADAVSVQPRESCNHRSAPSAGASRRTRRCRPLA